MVDYEQPDSSINTFNKPVVLTFVGHYLPGYKSGGILRITINTIDHLHNEFEFRIVTRDRDLGDDKPYPDITFNQWQQIGNATVYYLCTKSNTLKEIFNLIVSTPHHILYLNSFFDTLTIKVLLNRKLRKTTFKPVIVVPFGEFGWASLKQKFLKKFVFIQIARLVGLYDNVTWRASSESEKIDIIKYMKIESEAIYITRDLPIKNIPDVSIDMSFQPSSGDKGMRIVFLSRISREKNLDYALRILKKIKAIVTFDIYGPAENSIYWKECQELISQVPANVKVNYLGGIDANQVVKVFSLYDLFFFPTGGEAYGHVIAECLIAGTPVLISTETPWRNLQDDGLGWDVDLMQEESFVEIIEKLALLSPDNRMKMRAVVKAKIVKRLLDPKVLETNRHLFKKHL